MLIFDQLTTIALVVAVVSWLFNFPRQRGWARGAVILAAGLLFLHIALEGIRWQMAGAYAVAVISLCGLAWYRAEQNIAEPKRWLRTLGRVSVAFAGIVLLGSSWLFSWSFPMFDMSQPGGSYAVGLTEIQMVDTARPEHHTEDPGDNRELMVQVWYPAVPGNDLEPVPYWRHPSIYSTEVAKNLSLPALVFRHLRMIETHSVWNAQLPDNGGLFPILIFSHGFGMGWSGQNVGLMQSLASHGYVVFSIDHPFAGAATVFPNGSVVTLDESSFPRASGPPSSEAMELYVALMTSTDWREQVSLLKQMDSHLPDGVAAAMNAELDVWIEDQRFVLEQAEVLQTGSAGTETPQFAGRLDLESVGIFGMSFGGSAALENCATYARCKAGANLDGFMNRHTQLPPLERPFLFMNSESNFFHNAVYEFSNGPAYAASIVGSQHMNYTDLSVIAPGLSTIGVLGSIEGSRMQEITDTIIVTFFDEHLKRTPQAGWSDIDASQYPEVRIRSKD